MAPQQGGGGIISNPDMGGHSKNQCDNSAITLQTAISRLVIDGVCLALSFVLIWLWLRARRRTPSIRQLLPWYTFGVLLALTVIYLILGILLTVLGRCLIISGLSVASVSVPASVASGIATLFLLGVILLPLTWRMLEYAGHSTRVVTIMNIVGLGLSTVIFIPSIVLSNMASINRFMPELDSSSRNLVASLSVKFSVAYYTTYFVVALLGSIVLGFAVSRANLGISSDPQKQRIWISCTILSLLVGSGSAVIQMYAFTLPARPLPSAAWIAFLGIFNVFFILTIFGALKSAQAIAVPVVDPTENATYDPDSSEETQPALHKRFTYTGTTELQLPPNAYTHQNSSWPLHSPLSPKWPFSSPTKKSFGISNDSSNTIQHAF